MRNWFTGAQKYFAKEGYKGGIWKLAKHKEVHYLSDCVKKVGEDSFGNEYFEDNTAGRLRGRDRWVQYAGNITDYPYQPAQIPPEWNAWIHQIDDRPPQETDELGGRLDPCSKNFIVPGAELSSLPMYDHVKPHRENPTGKGLEVEYRQPGHWAGGNYRPATYSNWSGDLNKAELGPPNPNN